MKRFLVCLLLSFCLFPSGIVQAFDIPAHIRVGLRYDNNAVEQFPVISETGFTVGRYIGHTFEPWFSLPVQSVSIHTIEADVYLSSPFPTYEEAKASGETGFVVYREEQYFLADTTPIEGVDPYSLSSDAIALTANGFLTFVAEGGNLGLEGEESKQLTLGTVIYRGGVSFTRKGGGNLSVINMVPLEEYLYGVVPGEMPASFEPDALKVQAVCARNYVLTSLGKYEQYGFDVTNNTSSQMYLGVSGEQEATTKAVQETAGQVLLYDGELAQTFYSSMSGGATENVKYVWGSNIPYLCGVEDPYEQTDTIRGGTWEVTMTADEIQKAVEDWGRNVGKVTNIEVIEYTPGGSVYRMKITGTEGETIFEREQNRNLFSFRSQKFIITSPASETEEETVLEEVKKEYRVPATIPTLRYPNSSISNRAGILLTPGKIVEQPGLLGESVLVSERVQQEATIEKPVSSPGVWTFSGRGYGHGLGMSQWGAQGMAQAGFSYDDILTHYFPGTYLEEGAIR